MGFSFRSVGVAGPGRRLVVGAVLTVVPPVAAQEFESPPTLRAADVLPREALKGPHHGHGYVRTKVRGTR